MENKGLLFSVVVPSYNRCQHLEKLIEKFSFITYQFWELIIVDDGSSDNTSALFQKGNIERVKYIRQENKERGAARNRGLLESSGEYIVYLDSDDYFLPQVFDVAIEIISTNHEIPVFHLGYEVRNGNDEVVSHANLLPDLLNSLLIERNVIACLGLFMKREVALDFMFNEDRDLSGTEDYELWIRIAAKLPVKHFNRTVAVLVEHEGRSMLDLNVDKIVTRIERFIHYTLSNPSSAHFIGSRINEFISFRYSYIALHATLASNKIVALKYLGKAIFHYPKLIFNKRIYVIVKKLIFGIAK